MGRDIYEKLIKGYTEKQWGRDCKDLPAFIIKRLPVRLTFDNNYFNALYQGIPIGGYTKMIANLLDGIEVRLNTDYLENKAALDALADKIVYTGPIDAYFDYKLGTLEYRSVRFENELLDKPSFQGNAAVNYTDRETPWTRIIEHKWFEFGKDENGNDLPKTIISREYSSEWKPGDEPYYPVNDAKNGALYAEYKKLADAEPKVIFGGRWVSIRITTWIRLSPPCWTAAKASCTKVQPSESTKFKRQQSRPPKAKIGVYFAALFLFAQSAGAACHNAAVHKNVCSGQEDAVPHTEPQRGASERNRRLRRLLARRSAGAVLKP